MPLGWVLMYGGSVRARVTAPSNRGPIEPQWELTPCRTAGRQSMVFQS